MKEQAMKIQDLLGLREEEDSFENENDANDLRSKWHVLCNIDIYVINWMQFEYNKDVKKERTSQNYSRHPKEAS